jgi:hypothetical protein
MMKFNIKNTIGITVFFISQAMSAQFYAGIQYGGGSLLGNVEQASAGYRPGGALKAGYIYSLTSHIGIGTGVELAQYKQQVRSRNSWVSSSNYQVDASSSAFLYTVRADNYKEKQTLQAVEIPLYLAYKTPINKGIDFNFRAGVKYFLPLKYKFDVTANNVKGTAYYPDVNLSIDDLPEYGFGTQNSYSASGEYQTRGIVMSIFELGFTFDTGKKNALYAAMFFEKGSGSILKQDKEASFIGYNASSVTDRKANGLYSTHKNADIRPVGFGLTLGWVFK